MMVGAGGEVIVDFHPLDENMRHLDDEESLNVHLEVTAAVAIDVGRLRDAVHRACVVHPFARARLATDDPRARRNTWLVPPDLDLDPVSLVHCRDDDVDGRRAAFVSTRVPLHTSPPFRLLVLRAPSGDRIVLNANHAANDGVGSLRLLQAIARAYSGDDDPIPVVDPLGARLHGQLSPATLAERARRYRGLARLAAASVRRGPSRPVPLGDDPDELGYGLALRRVDDVTALGGGQWYRGATLNDVLLATLHLSIADWNAQRGQGARRVSAWMPTNQRRPEVRGELLGNFSVQATTWTRPRQRRGLGPALAAVTRQTRRAKAGEAGALLAGLAVGGRLSVRNRSRLHALATRSGWFWASSMVSNLGQVMAPPVFRPEGVGTTELWFSPPARMPTGAVLGAVGTASGLHLTLRYSRRQFGADAADRFFDLYLRTLDRYAARAPSTEAERV